MGERTSYAPGTFSWVELVTGDADAAKAFYTEIFGWEYHDNPVGDGMVYSTALVDGKAAGALFASAEQPPHWNCYVTVASVDETTRKAAELGANVMAEPFDVMEVGRMSVIADPTGAALCLWEAKQHIGAAVVNQPGTLTWNDLLTPDPDTAARFYGDLFGWTFLDIPDSGGYRVIRNGERSNGGIQPPRDSPGPPAWLPYFGHVDVDAGHARVGELGGRTLAGPMDIGMGRIAVAADPQGAVFALWTCDYED
jgi:predicted enzyme related to lactoylglutathione lyase